MTIGSVASASASSGVAVKLMKQQSDQEAAVVNTLIQSAVQSGPVEGKGGLLNVHA